MSEIKVNSIKGVGASSAAISVDNSNGTCTLASGSKLNNCTTDGTTNLTIADGNLVFSTSGHGIDFSATSDASGMSSELLDDYEEGTWTPVLNASSYSLGQDMFYTKVGRVVFISGSLSFTSITGGSGTIQISGLPFTSINSNDAFTTISAHAYESLNVGNTSYQFQTLRVNAGSTFLRIIIPTGNGNTRNFGDFSQVANSKFVYRVAGYYITA